MDSRSSRDSGSAQPALAASKRHEQASSNEEEHLLSFIHLRPQTLGASLIPCKHSKKGKNAKYKCQMPITLIIQFIQFIQLNWCLLNGGRGISPMEHIMNSGKRRFFHPITKTPRIIFNHIHYLVTHSSHHRSHHSLSIYIYLYRYTKTMAIRSNSPAFFVAFSSFLELFTSIATSPM